MMVLDTVQALTARVHALEARLHVLEGHPRIQEYLEDLAKVAEKLHEEGLARNAAQAAQEERDARAQGRTTGLALPEDQHQGDEDQEPSAKVNPVNDDGWNDAPQNPNNSSGQLSRAPAPMQAQFSGPAVQQAPTPPAQQRQVPRRPPPPAYDDPNA